MRFEPIEPEFALEEFCEFETPVEQIDSLLFVGARMIDCLATRAAGRALALRSLTVEMGLEGGGTHGCAIRPAVPTIDRKFLLKLLQLEIGAHPPQAAVVRLTLRAEAGVQSKVQLGLFAPQTPEPSRLDVTLARLRAMVGEERVGSPVLEDTHRADGFRMEGLLIPGPQMQGGTGHSTGSMMEPRKVHAVDERASAFWPGLRPEALIERAAELEMPAMALPTATALRRGALSHHGAERRVRRGALSTAASCKVRAHIGAEIAVSSFRQPAHAAGVAAASVPAEPPRWCCSAPRKPAIRISASSSRASRCARHQGRRRGDASTTSKNSPPD
jgi:hypothetical protein